MIPSPEDFWDDLLPLIDDGQVVPIVGREVLQMEPLNEERKHLLHNLASREVCGFDACPSRAYAREHALTNPRDGGK